MGRIFWLVASVAVLSACASDPTAVYRAAMPAPASSPTAEELEHARATALTDASSPLGPRPAQLVALSKPTATDIRVTYPSAALSKGITGAAELDCLVRDDGTLACAITSETPPGQGFGEGGRWAAGRYRFAPKLQDGRDAAGVLLHLKIGFDLH